MPTGDQAPFLTLPPGGVPPDRAWWLLTPDGIRLRAGLWRAAGRRGQILMLPGRSEYLEQQALPAAEFVRRGFDVVSFDWRGQGLADRVSHRSPFSGHIEDFAHFQDDLDAVLADPLAETGLPRVLLGNSMGGAIALAALARDGLPVPAAAILTAPMFGIALGAATRVAAWMLAEAGSRTGFRHHWPPGRDVHLPYVFRPFEGNLLTGDREIWDWMVETARAHPALTIGMPTLGWLSAARRAMGAVRRVRPPECPILCLVGSEERVVDAGDVTAGAARLGARLAVVDGARHILLAEAEPMRAEAWAAIDDFLDGALPRQSRRAERDEIS